MRSFVPEKPACAVGEKTEQSGIWHRNKRTIRQASIACMVKEGVCSASGRGSFLPLLSHHRVSCGFRYSSVPDILQAPSDISLSPSTSSRFRLPRAAFAKHVQNIGCGAQTNSALLRLVISSPGCGCFVCGVCSSGRSLPAASYNTKMRSIHKTVIGLGQKEVAK